MAQPLYPNPTLQARIGSSTTEVNLRDWLNTRLAPFLKKAITESLDSEYAHVFLYVPFAGMRPRLTCCQSSISSAVAR